jgi:hypothetical protein
MLSASLASVEAYDAFSLSPTTVAARVLASRRTSLSRISRAIASAVFAASNALRVRMFGWRKYAICTSLRRHRRDDGRVSAPLLNRYGSGPQVHKSPTVQGGPKMPLQRNIKLT